MILFLSVDLVVIACEEEARHVEGKQGPATKTISNEDRDTRTGTATV